MAEMSGGAPASCALQNPKKLDTSASDAVDADRSEALDLDT
jgi:hypothetical protein